MCWERERGQEGRVFGCLGEGTSYNIQGPIEGVEPCLVPGDSERDRRLIHIHTVVPARYERSGTTDSLYVYVSLSLETRLELDWSLSRHRPINELLIQRTRDP